MNIVNFFEQFLCDNPSWVRTTFAPGQSKIGLAHTNEDGRYSPIGNRPSTLFLSQKQKAAELGISGLPDIGMRRLFAGQS